MKKISKYLGFILYAVLSRINARFFLPSLFANLVESLRKQSLVLQGATIGKNSFVRSNVFIACPKNLKIGDGVKIGDFSRIYNFSDFIVGDNTEIGPGLHVQTNEHNWTSNKTPIAKQGCHTKIIEIGQGTYIGANVTLLSGVFVGSFLVIAAGAVVVKDLNEKAVYGGIPAKKIKDL